MPVIKLVLNSVFQNFATIIKEKFCIYNKFCRNSFKNFKDDLESIIRNSGKCCVLIHNLNINTLEKSNEETK